MSSRSEQKQRARAEREAAEREAARSAGRRRRLYSLGAAVLAAAVMVAVAVAIGSSGSSKPKTSGASAKSDVTAVAQLLSGIPQSGNRLGMASAPVTIDYYGDLQCPVCRDFTLGALPELISTDVRAGTVKLRYRSLQTATADLATFRQQQVAALAAGRQRRLWHYVELFYRQQGTENSGYVTGPFLQRIAEQVPGLDLSAWTAARDNAALTAEVTADGAAAARAAAAATPTLIIAGPKGTRTAGDLSYAGIAADIAAVSS
ncbi:MAG TPA: thioredoxin domain-containing protein [Solirubrobacteraceae bacterium]|nr:thioredoxin domain-containing protein [Solirubrobacteraceae bacterium]